MDGWLTQTRLIPDGDNIDLYDEDDAGQKEAMVPSIVSFYHFFSGSVFLAMTMSTKQETRVAYIGFLDHFFSDQTMFAWILDNEGAELKSYGCLYRFFSIHYFSRTKLCLPLFLTMMMPTKEETSLIPNS